MKVQPVRLLPGSDLRQALELRLAEEELQAGWVIGGIGSLSRARIRLAGREAITPLTGDLEILSLSGSLSPDGVHLHISVADADGTVTGGHLAGGSLVRTTAELLVAWLPDWRFARELEAATGFAELRIEAASAASG